MNLFELAYMELEREGKLNSPKEIAYMIHRAKKIRAWLTKNPKATTHILNGGEFYRRADGRLKLVK